MSDKKKTVPSPAPVLVMFALALLAILQLLFPDLISPGLTLVLIGVVFLVLFFIGWIHDALSLILGWMLAGFGVSFWASTQPQWAAFALPLILIGLGLGFVAIFVTGTADGSLEGLGKRWPLVPGALLLLVAVILILEGVVGRQRLWSLVVPLIPAVSAVWYMMEWRRMVAAADKR